MPKSRKQKEVILTEIIERLKNAKGTVLAVYSGLKVQSDRAFRHQLYQAGIEYSVIKKTLLKKALGELNYPLENVEAFKGNISVATSEQDEVAPAQALETFIKDNQTVSFVGGILEHRWLSAEQVQALAKLPSRETLLAQTVGTIKSPLTGFVNVLAGNLRGLVNVLKAVQEKK